MTRVIITGATGMIGGLVLKESLESDQISEVVSIGRRSLNVEHPKLKEIIRTDFIDYSDVSSEFKNIDIVYFCLGVYTGAVSNEQMKVATVDYALELAKELKSQSPEATFCFLSGAGADRSEKSRTAFAKYKGMAENGLVNLAFKNLFIFRPGYIYPVKKRIEPNLMYRVSRALYPILKFTGDKYSIKSTELASGIFQSGFKHPEKSILENKDILDFLRTT